MGSDVFFATKGIVSLLSVVLLTYHMTTTEKAMRLAQRMRYVTLLGFAVVVAGGSGRQLAEGEVIKPEHWGSLIVSIFLVVTALVSIRDERVKK